MWKYSLKPVLIITKVNVYQCHFWGSEIPSTIHTHRTSLLPPFPSPLLFSLMLEKHHCRFMIHGQFYCRSLHTLMNIICIALSFLCISTSSRLLFIWTVNSLSQVLSISLCVFIQCRRQWGYSWFIIRHHHNKSNNNNPTPTFDTYTSTRRFVKYLLAKDVKQHSPPTSKVKHHCLKKFICMITFAHCVLLRGRNEFMNASEELTHRCEYE